MFRKIVHVNDLCLILTEAGKLFLNGSENDNIFKVLDGSDSQVTECFKEVDT